MRARVLALLLLVFGALQFTPHVGVASVYAAVNTTMCTNGYKNGSSGATCNPQEAYQAAYDYASQLIAQENRCQPGASPVVVVGTSTSGGAYGTGTAGY